MSSLNYYSATGGLGLSYLGQAGDQMSVNMAQSRADAFRAYRPIWTALALLSGGASAYHGYKRSRGSVGAAVGWGLLGGVFPVIVPAVALAQGFGKPKGR